MNSFMSWVGGKKSLRDAVLARFPPYYERYIEVFGGAGWILFHKPPGNDFEVYNDFNSNLVNLYRCVRDNPNKLKYKLRYVLDSRQDFEWIASLHKRGLFPRFRDYDRAAKFYQLVRYSYASGLDSFGSQPHSIWSDFPMIDMAARRLQKVVIENKDFEKLIRQYDRPVSFFYCDPPYFATENYYKDVGFTTKDHSEASLKAHVHCVIVGFSVAENTADRRLFDNGIEKAVKNINAFLVEAPNVFIESRSTPICDVPILESMEQTVSHYSGQLDLVYLYCNKDINTRTKTYQKAEKALIEAGIELSLITGDCLLEKVRRYGDLGLLYFSQNYLSQEWFQEQLDASLDALGRRYNGLFNIETSVERLFNLFIRDEKAVDWINHKLIDAMKEIQYRRSEYSDYDEFLTNVSRFIHSIPRITKENILDSLSWAEEIQQHFAKDFNSLMEKRQSLEDQIAEIDFSAMGNNTYRELNQEFMRIDWLVSIPELVKFDRMGKPFMYHRN